MSHTQTCPIPHGPRTGLPAGSLAAAVCAECGEPVCTDRPADRCETCGGFLCEVCEGMSGHSDECRAIGELMRRMTYGGERDRG